MALPAVVMAYREKENIAKLAVYAIAGIAVIYFGYKIYKQIKKFGAGFKEAIKGIKEGAGAVVEGIKEGIEEIEQYGMTKPLTPKDTAEKKTERVKPTYKTNKELAKIYGKRWQAMARYYKKEEKKTERVKPTYKTNKEIMAIEGKRWQARYEAWIKAKPTYKTNKELAKIYGKRWQAMARYYKRRKPASPLPKSMRIKPILDYKKRRFLPAVLPRERMVIAL